MSAVIKKARKTLPFRAGMQSAGRSPAILGQERVRTMGDLAIRKSTKSRVKPAKPMLFGASTGRLRLRRLLGKADTPNCRCAGAPASKLRNPLPSGRGGVNPLPNISEARLPASYEAAKTALSQCSRIDECKDWADKAAALASYAKQAKDDTMRKMAERIQARAIRRCGELLKQVEAATGGQPYQDRSTRDGSVPSSRTQAATEAGLSERQRKTALRIASIPEDDFEQVVESENPPTVSQLAEAGTQKKPKPTEPLVDLGAIPPADFARATQARGTLRRFAEFCQANEPTRIAKACMPHEVNDLRRFVAIVDTWLDKFVTNLPE